MAGLYNKVENFVKDSFIKASKETQIKHFERTVYWLKKLMPDADEALLISAIAHDIERAFREKEKSRDISFNSLEYIRPHQEKGAEIISDFLKKQSADEKTIARVVHLISRHEEGGDKEQNLLKDADSLSFFDTSVETFLNKIKTEGKKTIRAKFDWMYNRITSNKAKKIAKPMYENAIRKLDLL